ncbi:MAG: Asp-tRNA(Asn)/Glu-tRNA(Gln) amidotransferase subunit GatC [Acidimicrobiia bacterium]|nr:Asp-tRNA(Asn)/Glu-tRNA(Gln) amidotransferase subunit GatC [Acidimicrobiia bacterium]
MTEPPTARISRDEVVQVARLARLELTDEELDLFTGQLAGILEHAEDVEALDVEGIEPTSHPFDLVNVLRADVVGPTLDRDEVLTQAPAVESNRFKVPPVLGEEP